MNIVACRSSANVGVPHEFRQTPLVDCESSCTLLDITTAPCWLKDPDSESRRRLKQNLAARDTSRTSQCQLDRTC